MAEIRGVWGIDIGLAGLKAVRLVYAEAAGQVLATAFDYVPHPKILSQPDANPDELIGQALDTFLSRNLLKNDGVAISVPGQTALARFIQLPPVESSKVVEIVKYEARQQIPFALDEVIWDYQPLGVGSEESGFLLDAEVGLFAMKRDQVQQHLAPFLNRKVEVELVQIAPLALYNYLCHDRFGHTPGQPASSEQDDYTLLLDMGADNTTLLVSNGKKIWIRNVPLGGNHFTRALTKEMKLTFAKAEHLKCNATKSPDPKAVFQALRPVFNDYVAEIQRSIGYFSSVNRDAKIGKIIGVGNGFKLAGLQKFLAQNLQMEVERVDSFPGLAGDAVLGAPLFQENLLSFAVPYGLALQGLKITRVHTSLLPPEITTARLVRKKKPWAVATAATLLFGLATSALGYSHVWNTVSPTTFTEGEKKATDFVKKKDSQKSSYEAAVGAFNGTKVNFEQLVGGTAGKTEWLDVYKAMNACLPRDYGNDRDEPDPTKRNRMRIFSVTATKYADLNEWFTGLDKKAKAAKDYMRADDKENPPQGSGYVFTLRGRHFHNSDDFRTSGMPYVRDTLLRNLQKWAIPEKDLQTGNLTGNKLIPVRQQGMTHAAIVWSQEVDKVIWHEGGLAAIREAGVGEGVAGDAGTTPRTAPGESSYADLLNAVRRGGGLVAPGARPTGAMRGRAGSKRSVKKSAAPKIEIEGDQSKSGVPIPMTGFIIEFVWKPVPESQRQATDPAQPAAGEGGAREASGAPETAGAPAGAPVAPAIKDKRVVIRH
ncbi:MAG: type IV pilus assembly protein PilM [Planctomycetaceae bacterium]